MDLVEIVVVHAEVVAAMGSNVVWLGRMCHGEVVGELDAFGG